jgi:5-formyltetrahydrofolate cyclo-ligase
MTTLNNDDGRAAWRRRLRERRRAIDPGEARRMGARILEHLQKLDAWQRARSVAAYLANDGEVPTEPVIDAARAAGKRIYLPVVFGRDLAFGAWAEGDALRPNRYGIPEPACATAPGETLDLLLVPLVGFTARGFRLGMGGGFYDRYLAADGGAVAIGLAFGCQREDRLESLREPWDRPVAGIVTEEGWMDAKG